MTCLERSLSSSWFKRENVQRHGCLDLSDTWIGFLRRVSMDSRIFFPSDYFLQLRTFYGRTLPITRGGGHEEDKAE